MVWRLSHRADRKARIIADRHYNRQKVGAQQFAPSGSCFVLYTETDTGRAFWITSAPFAEYVKHAWPGAWVCSAFRNEGAGVASDMIRQAVAATLDHYGQAPALGMVTFVNRAKVKPTRVRGRDVWGWCFRKAGFVDAGETQGGLLALQLHPSDMPPARPALVDQGSLFA
jgi:hypothetical protein